MTPHKVSPGYARRWLAQGLELVFRSFHPWFATSLVLSLGIVVLPGGALLAAPLGLLCYSLSLAMARESDRGDLSWGTAWRLAPLCFDYTLRHLWTVRWVVLGAIVTATALLWVVAQQPAAQGADTPTDLSSPLAWVFGIQSPLALSAAVLWVGAFTPGWGSTRLPMLRYEASRLAGAEQAGVLLENAARINVMPTVFLEFGHLLVLGLALIVIPGMVPFLMCALPAVAYVAAREMFEHSDGNAPERRTAESPAVERFST